MEHSDLIPLFCETITPISLGNRLSPHICVLVTQSRQTLCNPADCSPPGLPGSPIHGILQARILEWVAMSFSRGSSRPRDRSQVSGIVDGCLTAWATRVFTHGFMVRTCRSYSLSSVLTCHTVLLIPVTMMHIPPLGLISLTTGTLDLLTTIVHVAHPPSPTLATTSLFSVYLWGWDFCLFRFHL